MSDTVSDTFAETLVYIYIYIIYIDIYTLLQQKYYVNSQITRYSVTILQRLPKTLEIPPFYYG